MSLTRRPGESDAELRERLISWDDRKARNGLFRFLFILGIKSARPSGPLPKKHIMFGKMMIYKPGVY